jgi:hypothetical protein
MLLIVILNDPENGITIFAKNALAISEQLNNRYGMAISESNLAGHLILLNKPDDALTSYNSCSHEQLCLSKMALYAILSRLIW